MTNFITTHFDERGEAHIDESQLKNLHFDTNPDEIRDLCIAEGQVYKPKDEYILTPDALGHINYPVVKHKYDEWLEKRNISVKKDMNYSANEIKLISAIKSRITKQRLLNVISHGEIEATEKNTGKFIKTMLADIKEEIIREEPEIEISGDKLFGKHGGEVAKLYRDYLIELGDNYLNE